MTRAMYIGSCDIPSPGSLGNVYKDPDFHNPNSASYGAYLFHPDSDPETGYYVGETDLDFDIAKMLDKDMLALFDRVYLSHWGTLCLVVEGEIVYTIYDPNVAMMREIQRDWQIVDTSHRYGDIYERKPAPSAEPAVSGA